MSGRRRALVARLVGLEARWRSRALWRLALLRGLVRGLWSRWTGTWPLADLDEDLARALDREARGRHGEED